MVEMRSCRERRPASRFARAGAAVLAAAACAAAQGAPAGATIQLDPFAQASSGFAGCPPTLPPLLTLEQSRIVAHERAERGTRCAMEGTCEPGGAYRRDGEVNERVRAAIAAEPKFANTSLWLSTTRKWVTVSGCVRTRSQQRSLVEFVKRQPMVERVFDETRVGTRTAAAK